MKNRIKCGLLCAFLVFFSSLFSLFWHISIVTAEVKNEAASQLPTNSTPSAAPMAVENFTQGAVPTTDTSPLEIAKKDLNKVLDENNFLVCAKRLSSSKVKLSWPGSNGTFTFRIYSITTKGGKIQKKKLLATTKKNSFVVSKLNKNKQYKYCVEVYAEISGKKIFLIQSLPLALKTGRKQDMNIKKIIVTRSSTVLHKKQTHRIRCRVKLNGNKLCYRQPVLYYDSTNRSVAKVDASGNIIALKKGKAVIFVIAPSGAYDKVFVEVD